MIKILEKAAQLGIFVPWEYVFADSALTATTAARPGYQLAKKLIQSKLENVACLLIDEVGRASRDAIESLSLGRIIENSRKRMVGASDSFDSDSTASKMMLHVFAMTHEMFIDQLKAKVNRGMEDAFQQGKVIFTVAVGYKLVPVLDSDGNPMKDNNGKMISKRVVDEDEAKVVLKCWEDYGDRSWSRDRIAAYLNSINFADSNSWDSSMVKQMLSRDLYLGVEYYHLTRHVRDPNTGVRTTIRRPKSEWKVRYVPELRIVPDDLGKRVKDRLAKSLEAHKRNKPKDAPNRCELHPRTLVRPYCGVCGEPMTIGRTGQYCSYFCNSGKVGKKKCNAKGYKTARIIDTAILERIASEFFSEDFIARVVVEANHALQQKPMKTGSVDPETIRASIRKKEKALQRINDQLTDEKETGDLKSVFARIRQMETQISEEKEFLRVQTLEVPKSEPITAEAVRALMEDLRGLLQGDVGAAAPIIAAITGPVMVHQEANKNGGKSVWKARFRLNSLSVLCELARKRNCPTASLLEFLKTARWTNASEVEVDLVYLPKYVLYASKIVDLSRKGYDVHAISQLMKASPDTVNSALAYARSGGITPDKFLPIPSKPGKTISEELSKEVLRLREEEKLSFLEIGNRLKVNAMTARNAYDRKVLEREHPFHEDGTRKKRDGNPRLSKKVFGVIKSMLARGHTIAETAKEAGCSEGTVRRYRSSMS